MEPFMAVTISILFGVAVYLMLSRSIIRLVIGTVVLTNAANLLFFTSGRLTREVPPVIPYGVSVPDWVVANPLPQALVLTAIVISFSMFAFILALAYRSYEELGTDNSEEMRMAEPVPESGERDSGAS